MLDHAEAGRERLEIVCRIPEPAWDRDEGEGPAEDWNKQIRVSEWSEWPNGTLLRWVYVPTGMEWPPKDPASRVEITKGDLGFPSARAVELPPAEPEKD